MKRIIDIDEEIFEKCRKKNYGVCETLMNRIINSTPLELDEMDKQEIAKSVVLLDLFTKTYCRYMNDYERFDDLKFRCNECPFINPNGDCMCQKFKSKYAPDYRDFGSMGDL